MRNRVEVGVIVLVQAHDGHLHRRSAHCRREVVVVGHHGPHDFTKRGRAVRNGHDVIHLHRFDAGIGEFNGCILANSSIVLANIGVALSPDHCRPLTGLGIHGSLLWSISD